MEVQQRIALDWAKSQVGKTIDVIVDSPDPEVPNYAIARSHARRPGDRLPGARQGQGPTSRRFGHGENYGPRTATTWWGGRWAKCGDFNHRVTEDTEKCKTLATDAHR